MYVSIQQPQNLSQAFQLAERCESTLKGVTKTPLPAHNNNQRYYNNNNNNNNNTTNDAMDLGFA